MMRRFSERVFVSLRPVWGSKASSERLESAWAGRSVARYAFGWFACCLLLGSLVVMGAYAARLSMAELTGTFALDTLKVRVESQMLGEGVIRESSSVPVKYTITEEGADCYVRVKAEYHAYDQGGGEAARAHDLSAELGPLGWVFAPDGYAYLSQALERSGSCSLICRVGMPSGGGSSGFAHTMTVEAVQARNFQPNFSAASPWGDVEIQEGASSVASVRQGRGGSACQVTYLGPGQLKVSESDPFSHFATMLPGDSCEGVVTLRNEGSASIRVSLAITPVQEHQLEALLEGAHLCVTGECGRDAEAFWEGSLARAAGAQGIFLGTLSPGECRELSLRLSLEEGLDNQVAAATGQVGFRFQAFQDDEDASQPGTQALFVPSASSGASEAAASRVVPGGVAGATKLPGDASPSASSVDGEGRATTTGGGSSGATAGGALARMLRKTGDFLAPVAPALGVVLVLSGAISALSAARCVRRVRA